jgi:hypothetical protein
VIFLLTFHPIIADGGTTHYKISWCADVDFENETYVVDSNASAKYCLELQTLH